jgi:uncharacterized protein (UPF0212 family)
MVSMIDDVIICPECDAHFTVIWSLSIETEYGPTNCPFCGSEIDYAELQGV